MAAKSLTPAEFTGWWIRARRVRLGWERDAMARYAAARGAARVTRTLLVDLELGRRQPNFRTLPQLSHSLALPSEILASLVLVAERVGPELDRELFFDPENGGQRLASAEAALVSGRFGAAFGLAERCAADAADASPELERAWLLAASSAVELGATRFAHWRASDLFEGTANEATRGSAAMVLASAAWAEGHARRARLWLGWASRCRSSFDVACVKLVLGEISLRESRLSHARASLLESHEAALVAGSGWVAARAGRGLAEAFERMKRHDLARNWRRRHAIEPGQERTPAPPHDRKTFG